MERICAECKKEMDINKDNLKDVIKFENSCYHYDCFINACKRKSKKSNALPKWGEALDSIEEIKKDTYTFLEKEICKDDIFKFIITNYDIKVVPKSIFTKLSDIYNGTYKGLACCIPPEDLLDMWKQKMDYLIKVRARNITLGKEMEAWQQVNYDISVLINKYDSYLKWKERNRIIEQDVNKVHEDILKTVDLDKLSKIAQKRHEEDEEDIDSLLDELFD
jgi:hypothetical protein